MAKKSSTPDTPLKPFQTKCGDCVVLVAKFLYILGAVYILVVNTAGDKHAGNIKIIGSFDVVGKAIANRNNRIPPIG